MLLAVALSKGTSEYLSPRLTGHLGTNADVIRELVGTLTTFAETPDGVRVTTNGCNIAKR